jgi:RNA recognition motif-containing protein
MEKQPKKSKNKNIENDNSNNSNKQSILNQKNIILQNETLYVNHLNEKIKTDLLRENLYYLFSQYGDVLEINIRKSKKMRGQAFIVYKDINDATRAKVSLNNFLFLGSRINIDYAKSKSDIIVKIKGQSSQNNEEYQKTGTYLTRKRKRMLEYQNIKEEKKEKKKETVEKKESIELDEDIDGECLNENKILFVTGLGKEVNEKMISLVFNKFKGLKDIRFFNGRGFCFVEYDNEINAGTALLSLNNMKLTENTTMKISYAIKK